VTVTLIERQATRAVFVLGLAACGTPAPQLQIALAGPPSEQCPSTDCAQVPLLCDAVMSIRIVDPKDPSNVSLNECVKVPINRNRDMCSLRAVDLDATPVPVRDLEVQVALYPLSQIAVNPMTQDLVCPTNVAYSAAGFPVEQSPTPALGGHAYYHPGDTAVTVTLGCTDLRAINEDPTCAMTNLVSVTATVDDFDSGLPVTGGSPSLADHLRVSVGEPHGFDTSSVLNPDDEIPLRRLQNGLIPTWGGEVDHTFNRYACLEVLEDSAQNTSTLRCKTVTPGPQLDLAGVRLAKDTLARILKAMGMADFPDQGLTIGLVVDELSNAVPNFVVASSVGTVSYETALHQLGGGMTSATGVFVSRDAPFGTQFTTVGGERTTIPAIGGLVAGKVTIVVLQFTGS